jgi:CubicO group peptidase (beta-lactamase class C family)
MKALLTYLTISICFNINLNAQSFPDIFTKDDFKKISESLEILSNQLNLPGFSSCIIQNDSIVWTKYYGYSDIKKSKRTDSNTLYHCASITKSFASTIALRLIEQNKLGLDDLVTPDLLPILAQYEIPIDKKVGEIKVKHLLSHTSDDPPGTYYRYDGDKYSLLTPIISEASSLTFEETLQNTIADLGIENTIPCTKIDLIPNAKDALAKPYNYDSSNNLIPGQYTTQFNTSTGLVSSANDLGKFMIALYVNKIIRPESKQLAFSPFKFKTGGHSNYGLGWFVEHINGIKIVWNYGFGYSTSGLIVYIPEFKQTFIILSNSDRISRPFSLGLPQVSVLESPFAYTFIKNFVKADIITEDYPQINWDGSIKKIKSSISKANMIAINECLEIELKSQWNIARIVNDMSQQEKLLQVYEDIFVPTSTKENLIELANINSVREKRQFFQNFKINGDELVRIYAIADGGYCNYFGMYDEVYITEKNSNEEVWRMTTDYTEYAGGHPRNRKADLILKLPEGEYTVCFDNTKSPYNHYMDHWEAFPPKDLFWGIKVELYNKNLIQK